MGGKNKQENTSLILSKELDEIIGRPPHWLIQWGISLFFLVLLLILILSYFIKYPETINAPCEIIADNPAVPTIIRQNGTIIKVLIKEGATIKKNDTLLYWKKEGSIVATSILSTASGIINFISPMYDGQKIIAGRYLCYITSSKPLYNASLYVKGPTVERLRIGQQVKLTISGYPVSTYGYLPGIISYISNIQSANGYYVQVKLPHGLISNTKRSIPVTVTLQGEAEVIINKRKLIDKFLPR